MDLKELQLLLDKREFDSVLAAMETFTPSSPLERAYHQIIGAEAENALGVYRIESLDSAIGILLSLRDLDLLPRAKYLRAQILIIGGEFAEAREELSEAYYGFKRTGEIRGMGRSATWLAHLCHQAAEYGLAVQYFERATAHYAAGGFDVQVGMCSYNASMAHLRWGNLVVARDLLMRVLKQYMHKFPIEHLYNTRHAAAILAAQLGDFDWAKRNLDEASKLPSNYRREYFRQLEISGYVYTLAGDYKKAEQFLKDGEKLAFEIAPDSTLVSQIKRLFGDLYVLTAKYDLAERYATEGLAVAEKINERLEVAACYRIFAQVETQRKNGDKAREWYKKSIDLFSLISARYETALTRYLAACSGLHEANERVAMLYLAKEYFESEEVIPYIEKVKRELANSNLPRAMAPIPDGRAESGVTMIAASEPMRKVLEKISYIAPSDMNILITGATGTGKDLLASYIHEQSGRTGKFVAINAAAIPNTMIEAELFGSSKGSYTGADRDRQGRLEEADNGTVYLNEIADASEELQVKLLEVLESKLVRKLGSATGKKVNFRLVAATNHDLQERMTAGKFRRDLYFRLNGLEINLPRLEDRREEIPLLVEHFLKQLGLSLDFTNGERKHLEQFCESLQQQNWPGNIRELKARVKNLWLLGRGDLGLMNSLAGAPIPESAEDQYAAAVAECGGNQRKAARMLRVTEGTVRYHLKKRPE